MMVESMGYNFGNKDIEIRSLDVDCLNDLC